MAKRKNFTKDINLYPHKKDQEASSSEGSTSGVIQLPPTNTIILFPKNVTSRRNFNFSRFYGKGCDEIVFSCQQQIQCFLEASINTNGKTLSIATIVSYCREGISNFLPYCALTASVLCRSLNLTDINKSLIEGFIEYLENAAIKRSTPRNYYTSTKQILTALSKKKLIAKDIFPRNPFPNTNRMSKGETALSSKERNQLVYALKSELEILFNGNQKEVSSYDSSICLLAIALRTGINTTPLLELGVDCIQDHPLKQNRKLLVSYKRRGNSSHLTALRASKNIEMIVTVMPDIDTIIQQVIAKSEFIRELAPKQYQERLFLYKARKTTGSAKVGDVLPLTNRTIAETIDKLIKKYSMANDDGTPLRLNISRIRKTFVNRLWKLSGNDPIITAKLAGHTLKVSNDHYLAVSDEMVKNWQLMGEIRTAELLDNKEISPVSEPLENTPVGHCKDTQFGHLAPKNGEYCSNFLSCFRCPSYVITSDDLYRLFSFYWLLVREREQIGTRRWSRYYAHIIRIIDQQITPQFEPKIIADNRVLAKETPHPFWRNRDQIMEAI